MSPELRLLVGVLTTGVFALVGATLLAGETAWLGALLLLLAAYRGYFVARGIWAWITPDDDDDEEGDLSG